MRTKILTLAFLVMAMAGNAQTLKVNYKKGDVRTYRTKAELSMGAPMQGTQKATSEAVSQYTVKEADANGYTVELKALSYTTTGSEDVLGQSELNNMTKIIEKTPYILKLDKNGYITDLVNSDQAITTASNFAIDMTNKLYAKNPQLESMMPKAKALMALSSQITKENLLRTVREYSVFSLNGKDLKEGQPVDEKIMNATKVKSTYSVATTDGSTTVTRKSVGNMTEDDIKGFVKEQMEKMGMGDQASMIDQGWSQMKAMGMARLDLDDNATTTFSADGWYKTGTDTMSMKVMGAEIKSSTTTTAE